MAKNLITTTSLHLPKKPGEYHRLLCLTGPNKGISYYLTGKRVVLGRGNTADIQVLDPKTSREHAELVRVGSKYVVTDLKSQNGIVVNDLKVKQHELNSGDTLVIGKTVFKYSYNVVEAPPEVVEEDDEEEEDETDDETTEGGAKKKKSKLLIYGVLLLFLALMFLDDDSQQQKKQVDNRSYNNATEDFTNELKKKQSNVDRETEKKLLMILHNGLREYRERNYFRAIREFELALMISPNNARASFYLNKTKQAMDEEIEKNFMKAKRDTGALKYRSAVVSYCAIIKLLEGYQDDQRYKDAEDNLRFIEKKMGLEKGEISCF